MLQILKNVATANLYLCKFLLEPSCSKIHILFFLPLTPHGIERISATFRLSLTRHVSLYNEIHGLRLLLTSCKPIKEDHLVLGYELRQSYYEIRTQMTSNQNLSIYAYTDQTLNLSSRLPFPSVFGC